MGGSSTRQKVLLFWAKKSAPASRYRGVKRTLKEGGVDTEKTLRWKLAKPMIERESAGRQGIRRPT